MLTRDQQHRLLALADKLGSHLDENESNELALLIGTRDGKLAEDGTIACSRDGSGCFKRMLPEDSGIYPLERRMGNVPGNLRVACLSCFKGIERLRRRA